MKENSLENELQKPYKKTIIIGIIMMISFNAIANLDIPLLNDFNVNTEKLFIILSILSLIFLVSFPLFKIVNNKEKEIIKKIQEENALTDEIMLNEYLTADKVGKLLMTNNFTFIKNFFNIKLIPNKDIVWIFEKVMINKGKKTKELVIRTIDKKEYKVQIYQDKNLKKCWNNYAYHRHILLGYDAELDKLYKRNFNEFLNHQYYKED